MKTFLSNIIAAALVAAAGFAAGACAGSPESSQKANNNFPALDQNMKIGIVAHRGYWNCEEGGFSMNSLAALKAAQDNGFWGSECDVQLTSDGVAILNHDDDIDGLTIIDHSWEELQSHLLENGERRPLLEEWAEQGAQCPTTVLVCEIKPQRTPELEDTLVNKTVSILTEKGVYSPDRVIFISFSRHICEKIASIAPEFVNQYLEGDIAPKKLAKAGINGWDYEHTVVEANPQWVEEAHALGMSTNVWTVNDEDIMQKMIDLDVDAITTNHPMELRKILGFREYKKK